MKTLALTLAVLASTVSMALAQGYDDYPMSEPPTYLRDGNREITIFRTPDGMVFGSGTDGSIVTGMGKEVEIINPSKLPTFENAHESPNFEYGLPRPSQTLRKPPGKSGKKRIWALIMSLPPNQREMVIRDMAKYGYHPPKN